MNALGQIQPLKAWHYWIQVLKNLVSRESDQAQLNLFPDLKEILHVHTAGNSPAMADAASMTLLSNKKIQENGQRLEQKLFLLLL